MRLEHIQGRTFHARRGALKNAFHYGVDYVLWAPDQGETPRLFSHNRFNLWFIRDRHHGGPRGDGHGVDWFRQVLSERDFPLDGTRLVLLTQPSFLGLHFNPVSFWIALRDDRPCAFVAEVNNTFGDRHCYFCAHPDFRPIAARDTITAEKLMHVSPFQDVAGQYTFNLDWSATKIALRIAYENGDQGVLATLTGARRAASDGALLWAALRRPFGAARVVALIHWQALKLWRKRAPFRPKPTPPQTLISDNLPDGEART
ncbi:DUF1365 domain-containing protein [Actibacterium ureilyticum]|uniref:DUF1365 domain-containing protein n=1 Tax=Actibacterium ureilyticum TaxID=1590614 RepID=UPI000BAAB6D6|nr:DUF1365 domain-containing protein [Actibacterium ureilyticum]